MQEKQRRIDNFDADKNDLLMQIENLKQQLQNEIAEKVTLSLAME